MISQRLRTTVAHWGMIDLRKYEADKLKYPVRRLYSWRVRVLGQDTHSTAVCQLLAHVA